MKEKFIPILSLPPPTSKEIIQMTMPQQPQVNVNISQPPLPPQQPPVRQSNLRTKRSLLKYMLLGLITLGIYDIWQMSEVGETLNLIATRRDGKRTMHYCLMFFLVGWLTLGIGWLVWFHKLSSRIGTEQAARGLPVTVTAATYWLWNILGSLIIVGPFIYTYKLLHAMNDLCADYNVRG